MKRRFFVLMTIIISIFFLAGVTCVSAQQGPAAGQGQFVENVGSSGNINWSTGVIEAVGIGAPPERFYGKPQASPMAMRAAGRRIQKIARSDKWCPCKFHHPGQGLCSRK